MSPERNAGWHQPSLVRRMMLAVVLAFTLVAMVLIAKDYTDFRHLRDEHAALRNAAAQMADLLATSTDTTTATQLMRTLERQTNRARQDSLGAPPLLFELRRQDGSLIYASEGTPPLGEAADKPVLQFIEGRPYHVARADRGSWQIRLAEPEPSDGTIIGYLGRELAPSLLLAFPFVLLPVWLAVRQGIKPVQQLAHHLTERAPDDLSPLGVDLKYAELRPVIDAFNALLQRLHDTVQRERAFVHDAAHELRTPMAVISAQAHVLARAVDDTDRQQAEAAMDAALARASHLSQQLLALAALDETRPSKPHAVDVAALSQSLLAQAVPAAQKRGQELSLDGPDSLVLELEQAAFQSALQNLLDNARRYGARGGRVAVSLCLDGKELLLCVADDGPGIPTTEQAHIFERFVRGSGQTQPGTGLGLAIVRQAARRLGGHVDLGPGLNGRGAGFYVRIPAATPDF